MNYIIVFVFVFLFTLTSFFGYRTGEARVRDFFTIGMVGEFQKALEEFRLDNERYPDSDELADKFVMTEYYNVFPMPEQTSKSCLKRLYYKITGPESYSLSVCMERGGDNYVKGINIIQ